MLLLYTNILLVLPKMVVGLHKTSQNGGNKYTKDSWKYHFRCTSNHPTKGLHTSTTQYVYLRIGAQPENLQKKAVEGLCYYACNKMTEKDTVSIDTIATLLRIIEPKQRAPLPIGLKTGSTKVLFHHSAAIYMFTKMKSP